MVRTLRVLLIVAIASLSSPYPSAAIQDPQVLPILETVAPFADTYIEDDNRGHDPHGSEDVLIASGKEGEGLITLIGFDPPVCIFDFPVIRATFYVWVNTPHLEGFHVNVGFGIEGFDDGYTETGLGDRTRTEGFDESGPILAASWLAFDVTQIVNERELLEQGDGEFIFNLQTNSDIPIHFASRESQNTPYLEIEVSASDKGTPDNASTKDYPVTIDTTISPDLAWQDDSAWEQVESGIGTFEGTTQGIAVFGFNLPEEVATGTIANARLYLYRTIRLVTGGNNAGFNIHRGPVGAWDEMGKYPDISYDPEVAATIGPYPNRTWVPVDITSLLQEWQQSLRVPWFSLAVSSPADGVIWITTREYEMVEAYKGCGTGSPFLRVEYSDPVVPPSIPRLYFPVITIQGFISDVNQ